jgi:hypothetical protein
MKHTIAVFALFTLALAGCPEPPPKSAPGGSAMGMVIGSSFDGTPLTIGKGELAAKPVVITYFATW